jgi:glycerophosphoryl diester phosphodiesterase
MIFVRVLGILVPFVAIIGVAYWVFDRPRHQFLPHLPSAGVHGALAIAGVTVAALAVVLAEALSWLLVLPLVVFENVLPVRAFAESARRMDGRRKAAALPLSGVAGARRRLPDRGEVGGAPPRAHDRPVIGASVAGLLIFLARSPWGSWSFRCGGVFLAAFSLGSSCAYAADGRAAAARLPEPFVGEVTIEGRRWRVSFRAFAALLVGAVVFATGLAYLAMRTDWTDRQVTIFAHRGAAAEAPENTLAAFRLAGTQHTDYVELDVQESSDGVVVVVHDNDLMKIGGSPLKIWETTAEQLRAVDIGSSFNPSFSAERVPTLADALAACKGVSRVDIELKDYGHNERLEERVVELVEAAGMESNIVTMSLSRDMVAKMKRLRPGWTSGLLTAKAVGDLTGVPADFLAVEKATATRRFIRTAHRAGKPVYVWTVDDPANMIRMLGLGVDGLITNRPGVAREVLDRYMRMTEAERLLLFIVTSFGAEADVTPPPGELRP